MFTAGRWTVVYRFADGSGNEASCTFVILIEEVDTIPPEVVSCPSDFVRRIELGTHGIPVYWSPPSAIDLSGNISLVSQSHFSGDTFTSGRWTVVYRFADGSGNEAACSFMILIEEVDTIPPEVVSCPSDFVRQIELGTHSIPVYWSSPSAIDLSGNISLVSQSHFSGDRFTAGRWTVVYRFADWSGSEASCTFVILIEEVDTIPPEVASCPSDLVRQIELGTHGTPVYWSPPSAIDLSGNISLVFQSHFPDDKFTSGRWTVVYRFADGSGNEAACSFMILIEEVDTIPPEVVSCPADFVNQIELGRQSIPVYWSPPSAIDLSGNISLASQSHFPGDRFTAGRWTVVYRFADGSGNEASCTFVILIEEVDTIPPEVVSCPSDFVRQIELGTHSIPVYWSPPSAIDLSGNISLVSQSHFPGDRFTAGRWTVVYRFADGSGNEVSCSFMILIEEVDTIPPEVVLCPADFVNQIELGRQSIPVSWSPPSAIDLSGNISLVSQSHFPGDRFTTGRWTVVYRFADGSGNEASCSFISLVEEVDTIPPEVASCPSDFVRQIEIGTHSIPVYWIPPSAIDFSGNISLVSQSHFPGDKFTAGRWTVVYRFADGSGNEVSCSFRVLIEEVDTIPPEVVSCPADFVRQIELGTHGTPVYWSPPSAIDLSGNISLVSQSHFPGNRFTTGRWNVLYRFADGSGNEAYCSFMILIEEVDTTPPLVNLCPDDIIETIELGATKATVSWTEPQASDLSGNVTMSPRSRIPTTFSPFAETPVKYVFQDASGNENTCEFFVSFEIVDTTPPDIISCPENMHTIAEVGTSGIHVSWSKPFAIDHSGMILTRSSHDPGQMFPIGSTDVVFVFEDESGNQGLCNFSVNVEIVDTLPPEISACSSDQSDTIELGDVHKRVYWLEPEALDNSENVSLAFRSHRSGDHFTMGRTDVSYLFTDGSGNMAYCNFSITLITGKNQLHYYRVQRNEKDSKIYLCLLRNSVKFPCHEQPQS
ncbi:hyalin-like [Amphiura filiformis]|uniref:hyalin-like n=1 Tax=Amphiura filiformis TaxID=82378 RepID=UPI003B21B483